MSINSCILLILICCPELECQLYSLVNNISLKMMLSSSLFPRYLLTLADHIHSCRFGTFLFDSDLERVCLVLHSFCCVYSYTLSAGCSIHDWMIEGHRKNICDSSHLISL